MSAPPTRGRRGFAQPGDADDEGFCCEDCEGCFVGAHSSAAQLDAHGAGFVLCQPCAVKRDAPPSKQPPQAGDPGELSIGELRGLVTRAGFKSADGFRLALRLGVDVVDCLRGIETSFARASAALDRIADALAPDSEDQARATTPDVEPIEDADRCSVFATMEALAENGMPGSAVAQPFSAPGVRFSCYRLDSGVLLLFYASGKATIGGKGGPQAAADARAVLRGAGWAVK